mmetsp:Transcript_11895/g.17487  ORF Transcript_11895/g.17487 Transcript_11895/m.17487 type:complete len:82 (-) Transcript_11895:371-616(-)
MATMQQVRFVGIDWEEEDLKSERSCELRKHRRYHRRQRRRQSKAARKAQTNAEIERLRHFLYNQDHFLTVANNLSSPTTCH